MGDPSPKPNKPPTLTKLAAQIASEFLNEHYTVAALTDRHMVSTETVEDAIRTWARLNTIEPERRAAVDALGY